MKHLLNNLSEEEKNRIREQHEGGMRLAIDNFKKLVETKLGDAKPYLTEASQETCEACGNELTEGGECMECGSLYEEELGEQMRFPSGGKSEQDVINIIKRMVMKLDDGVKKDLKSFKNFDDDQKVTFFDRLMANLNGGNSAQLYEQMVPSQGPLRLQVFPVIQVDGEDGSPRDVKGGKASYYIDVDTEPVNVDNKDVTFSYSVRGRKDKGEGKYHTDYKNEIVLDSCFLDEWGDEKEFTTFDGKTITCGEKEFRLSSKGREQMNRVFGTRGYVSNDKGGKDMSNMA